MHARATHLDEERVVDVREDVEKPLLVGREHRERAKEVAVAERALLDVTRLEERLAWVRAAEDADRLGAEARAARDALLARDRVVDAALERLECEVLLARRALEPEVEAAAAGRVLAVRALCRRRRRMVRRFVRAVRPPRGRKKQGRRRDVEGFLSLSFKRERGVARQNCRPP